MPQDDIEEVRAALLGARHANENPVFYRMCILYNAVSCVHKVVTLELLYLSLSKINFIADDVYLCSNM